MNNTKRNVIRLAAIAPVLFAGVTPASAQVTFFQKPPSAQELRQALLAPGTRAGSANTRPAHVKSRGIVWNKDSGALPANDAGVAKSAPAAGMPINFGLGSASIEPDSIGFVKSVAEVMRTDPQVNLIIEGHTDASGGYRRNMVLSWERAMGVYRVLVEDFGIEPDRLQPVGKGPTEPMPGTTAQDGANRRVQFRVNG